MEKYQVMPDLSDEEYEKLKADIAERGVMVPIEMDQHGNILDGHHRLKACKELGIDNYPTAVRVLENEIEKLRHAWQLNTGRRNLTAEQRDEAIAKLKIDHPELSDRHIAYITGVDKRTVAKALSGRAGGEIPHVPSVEGMDGKQYPTDPQAQRDSILEKLVEHPEKSDREIARETGASHHTVARQRQKMVSVFNPSKRDADALRDPDIQRRLAENDGMNVAGAIREQRRDQLEEQLESIEVQEAKAIEGVYDVVVIDPPWPVQKMETDRRPLEMEMDYPVMSLAEIKQLEIPAADDCHVFLWTTEKLLPDSFAILAAWGVRYVLTFVWHKSNGGYKPMDLPIYNCEFCLYGRIGSPAFIDDHQFKACFETSITGHSEKPDEFYEMIRRVTAGRRLDMFNRRPIDGFDSWGKEAVS